MVDDAAGWHKRNYTQSFAAAFLAYEPHQSSHGLTVFGTNHFSPSTSVRYRRHSSYSGVCPGVMRRSHGPCVAATTKMNWTQDFHFLIVVTPFIQECIQGLVGGDWRLAGDWRHRQLCLMPLGEAKDILSCLCRNSYFLISCGSRATKFIAGWS